MDLRVAERIDRPIMQILIAWILFLAAAHPALSANPCVSCHSEEVAAYERTGMGRSLGRPEGQPGGVVTHAVSGSRLTIVPGDGGHARDSARPNDSAQPDAPGALADSGVRDAAMRHRLERGGLAAEYDVPYFIGSGNAGRSYLVNIGGYLFQSPASYYSQRQDWGMSPGFETDPNIDFARPVASQCLFCHSGRALPVSGTLNRYEDPPFSAEAISCDRCHGPAERHLAEPARGNILNPKRLEPIARASVCEQCHLAGEERITNPGRAEWDFQPGQPLEEVFSVYVRARPPGAAGGGIRVVSHAEQLAQSVCAQSSGDQLWCGSCHNPHETPGQAAAYYRQKCLDCHGPALLETHAAPTENCIGCHMPQREPTDVAHTAYTDHQIQRRPAAATDTQLPERLVAWREPATTLSERNRGLAYVRAGENHQSIPQLQQGYRLLTEARKNFPEDPAVLSALGRVLFLNKTFERAAEMFETAARVEPGNANHRLALGDAYGAMEESEKAIESYERAIELDPSLKDAYVNLAALYGRLGQPEKRRETIQRHLEFMPQSILAREAL